MYSVSCRVLNINSFALPDCRRCSSSRVIKDGRYKRRGKHEHRYRCKRCGYRFVRGDLPRSRKPVLAKLFSVQQYVENGTSLRKLASDLRRWFNINASREAIRQWVLAAEAPDLKPLAVGGVWHADETMIHCNGYKAWLWLVVDHDSRFIIAWRLSDNRRKKNAKRVLKQAVKNAGRKPQTIISDGYKGYATALGKRIYKSVQHIIDSAFGLNARIERVNRELKRRTKWCGCFQSFKSLEHFVALWLHSYHLHTNRMLGCSPAEMAGCHLHTT